MQSEAEAAVKRRRHAERVALGRARSRVRAVASAAASGNASLLPRPRAPFPPKTSIISRGSSQTKFAAPTRPLPSHLQPLEYLLQEAEAAALNSELCGLQREWRRRGRRLRIEGPFFCGCLSPSPLSSCQLSTSSPAAEAMGARGRYPKCGLTPLCLALPVAKYP